MLSFRTERLSSQRRHVHSGKLEIITSPDIIRRNNVYLNAVIILRLKEGAVCMGRGSFRKGDSAKNVEKVLYAKKTTRCHSTESKRC